MSSTLGIKFEMSVHCIAEGCVDGWRQGLVLHWQGQQKPRATSVELVVRGFLVLGRAR